MARAPRSCAIVKATRRPSPPRCGSKAVHANAIVSQVTRDARSRVRPEITNEDRHPGRCGCLRYEGNHVAIAAERRREALTARTSVWFDTDRNRVRLAKAGPHDRDLLDGSVSTGPARLDAVEANAITRPSLLMAGELLSPFDSAPPGPMLIRRVVPLVPSRRKMSPRPFFPQIVPGASEFWVREGNLNVTAIRSSGPVIRTSACAAGDKDRSDGGVALRIASSNPTAGSRL